MNLVRNCTKLISIYLFFLNTPCFSSALLDTIKYLPKSPLGKHFKRVVTQQEEGFKILSAHNKHLLLTTRWTNSINKGWISDHGLRIVKF